MARESKIGGALSFALEIEVGGKRQVLYQGCYFIYLFIYLVYFVGGDMGTKEKKMMKDACAHMYQLDIQ